jgi:hypothetical protein
VVADRVAVDVPVDDDVPADVDVDDGVPQAASRTTAAVVAMRVRVVRMDEILLVGRLCPTAGIPNF